MKFLKLALSLTVGTSLLAACGGGGGARSPDRLGTYLDTDSLFISFQPSTARITLPDNPGTTIDESTLPAARLVGSGNNSISVQMLGTQTDGIEFNLGPTLNVTGGTSWALSAVGDPAIAELADAVRDAAGLGEVQDILSSIRLTTDDSDTVITLRGTYQSVTREGRIKVIAPIAAGDPAINGLNLIPINPVVPAETFTTGYQLLQPLQNSSTPENRTNLVKFCSDSEFATIANPTPASGPVLVEYSNPFDPAVAAPQPAIVELFAISDKQADCDTAPNDLRVASLLVQIVPAQVSDIAICAITNPAGDVCGDDGIFLDEDYLSQCRGLDADSIKVPAAQNLQMVAKLTYTNPSNANQNALIRYQCASENSLSWTADPTTIYSEDLDQTDGDATFISRSDYLALDADGGDTFSDVTGTYTFSTFNEDSSSIEQTSVSASLTLNMVDAQVADLTIERILMEGEEAPTGNDILFLNGLGDTISYRALCTFVNFDSTDAPVQCDDSFVKWSVDQPTIVVPTPMENSATTSVGEAPNRAQGADGDVILTATYNDNDANNLTDTRLIETVDDPIEELHLFLSESGGEPMADPFSCVGRQDTVGTLQDGTQYAPAQQQYYAFAKFENSEELRDITDSDKVIFTATKGYSDNEGSCLTSADPTGSIPVPEDIPGAGELGATGPAASFSSDPKGELKANGALRLSTVCVQAFLKRDESEEITENDLPSIETSTALVLPVADDDLLTFSNELCGTLEPVLTLGAGVGPNGELSSGIIIPLVYGISLIADPVLANLGDAVPVEDILGALITGDFSTLDPSAPVSPFGGLGAITSILLGEEALGPVVTALDACLLDPTTATVSSLLSALLAGDPSGLGAPEFDDCTAVFDGFGGGGGTPELPGADGGDLGPLTDIFTQLSEGEFESVLQSLTDLLTGFGG